jgi:hypothetical protein
MPAGPAKKGDGDPRPTAKEKTKGAIKGAKQEAKSGYETLKHKVTG